MKKIISIICVFGMILAIFAGCAGNQTAPDTPATSPSAESPDSNQPAQAEGLSGEITYLTWLNQPGLHPEPLIEAFNTLYPDVKVNLVTNKDVGQYVQMQQVRFLAGEEVDVTSVRGEYIRDFAEAGYLLDLSGYTDLIDRALPSALDQVVVDGKYYVLPKTLNMIGVWYNKAIFADLGLEIPTNWDEFLAVCKTIQDSGITPLAQGVMDGWTAYFDVYGFIHKVFAEDPEIFDKIERGEAKYTDPEWIAAFTSMKEFLEMGYVHKNSLALTYDQARSLFMQGEVAMQIQGEWAMSEIERDNVNNLDFGAFPLPYNAPGEEMVVPFEVGSSEGIAASSKNMDAALEFLRFTYSEEGVEYLASNVSMFSATRNAPVDFHPYAAYWKPLMERKAVRFWYSAMNPAVSSEIISSIQMMYAGEITVEDFAKSLQDAQDSVS